VDELGPAPFFERAAALAIECALWISVSGAIFQACGMAVAPFGGSISMPWWPWSILAEGLLVLGALAWAYRCRRSPGMLAMDFVLLDTRTNERPNLFQCSLRAVFAGFTGIIGLAFGLAWLVAGAPHGSGLTTSPYFLVPNVALAVLLLSYVPMRFTRRRQSLFDLLTRTAVVKRQRNPGAAAAPALVQPP
jgi:hypothetical protein